MLISSIEMNMANNYKDNAQSDLADLEKAFREFVTEGKLSEKERVNYERTVGTYRERLKGYSHKDQKPYWHS